MKRAPVFGACYSSPRIAILDVHAIVRERFLTRIGRLSFALLVPSLVSRQFEVIGEVAGDRKVGNPLNP